MENIQKISSFQMFILIVSCRLITTYSYLPITNTPPANQDAWLIVILSAIFDIIIFWPILYLSNRFNDLTLVEYSEKIMGSFLGKIVGLVFICFFILISLLDLVIMAEFLSSTIMPETPVSATIILMVITCAYTIYKGLEVIGRIAELFVPFIFFTIIFFILLSVNKMDFNVFLPILADSSFYEVNYAAVITSSRFYDVIILCMAVPNLKKKSDLNKIFFYSVIITTLFFCIIILSVYAVLGVEQAKYSNYPFFTFT